MAMTVDKQKQHIKKRVDTILTACSFEPLVAVDIDATPGTVGIATNGGNYKGLYVKDFLTSIASTLEDYIADATGRNFVFTGGSSITLVFTEI